VGLSTTSGEAKGVALGFGAGIKMVLGTFSVGGVSQHFALMPTKRTPGFSGAPLTKMMVETARGLVLISSTRSVPKTIRCVASAGSIPVTLELISHQEHPDVAATKTAPQDMAIIFGFFGSDEQRETGLTGSDLATRIPKSSFPVGIRA
jgi:hypothetical protein